MSKASRAFLVGGIVAVLLVVVVFVVIRVTRSSGGAAGSAASAGSATASAGSLTGTALPASVIKSLTVSTATLDAVRAGTTYAKSVTTMSGPPLTSGGKPEVLYIGAEYCPFCAAERWAIAVALSRFGTFSGLHGIHSDSADVYPNTPTLTFYKSSYTSKYLAFTPVETTTVQKSPLQAPTAAQQALMTKYDAPPYVPAQDAGAIPFVDLGNKYLAVGAQYNPQALKGMTWAEAAAALNDPATAVAKGADGAANILTASLCRLTGNQPSSVCNSPMIKNL